MNQKRSSTENFTIGDLQYALQYPHAFIVKTISPHSRNSRWRPRSVSQKPTYAESDKHKKYTDVCNESTKVTLHPTSWNTYNMCSRTGLGTLLAIDMIVHVVASRAATSSATERFRLHTVLTFIVLQCSALLVDLRRLRSPTSTSVPLLRI